MNSAEKTLNEKYEKYTNLINYTLLRRNMRSLKIILYYFFLFAKYDLNIIRHFYHQFYDQINSISITEFIEDHHFEISSKI